MDRGPLDSQARRHLLWLAGTIVIGALATAPILWLLGAVGKFAWTCLVLCGILALGQREDALYEAQDRERYTREHRTTAPRSVA